MKPSQLNARMAKRFMAGEAKVERIQQSEKAISEQGAVSTETMLGKVMPKPER